MEAAEYCTVQQPEKARNKSQNNRAAVSNVKLDAKLWRQTQC